jgi:CheY-like chemotaxis protein
MTTPRILVVDIDDAARMMLQNGLQHVGFDVVSASNVSDALTHIATETFDVLLADVQSPSVKASLAVMSAIRQTQPKAFTVVLSDSSILEGDMPPSLALADEIITKPIPIASLKKLIHTGLSERRTIERVKAESVASILERELELTIHNWLDLVEQDAELTSISLSRDERAEHLPKLLGDLILRLELAPSETRSISIAARDHGEIRRKQGYTAGMVVEESRKLQVSIFETLRRNLRTVNFASVLSDIVTIADEVDSQLGQALLSYDPDAVKSRRAKRVQRLTMREGANDES